MPNVNQTPHQKGYERGFRDGVWFAVEYLVLTVDQPTIANQLIAEAGIAREDALRIMLQTRYGTRKLKLALDIFSKGVV